jgi:hypothetical protein
VATQENRPSAVDLRSYVILIDTVALESIALRVPRHWLSADEHK